MKRPVSTLLFIQLLLLGLVILTSGCTQQEGPAYELSTKEMLAILQESEYALSPMEVRELMEQNPGDIQLIDIRSPAEYELGHLDGAMNIPDQDLLEPTHLADFQAEKLTYILYGRDQLEANGPWMVLRQLGFENIKIMQGGYAYFEAARDSTQMTGSYLAEQARYDFLNLYREAVKQHEKEMEATKPPPPAPVKQIVPKPKKKKKVVEEEGC